MKGVACRIALEMHRVGRLSFALVCFVAAVPIAASIPRGVEADVLFVGRVDADLGAFGSSQQTTPEESLEARRLVRDQFRASLENRSLPIQA